VIAFFTDFVDIFAEGLLVFVVLDLGFVLPFFVVAWEAFDCALNKFFVVLFVEAFSCSI
jgi:hypothetical protein